MVWDKTFRLSFETKQAGDYRDVADGR